MSKRDTPLLLDDMLRSAVKIKDYTSGMSFSDFAADEKTKDAVVRNFEILGEAANRIDEEFKATHPEVEWQRIRGFRNRIVHDYFGVDYSILWNIVQSYLDDLIIWLRAHSECP